MPTPVQFLHLFTHLAGDTTPLDAAAVCGFYLDASCHPSSAFCLAAVCSFGGSEDQGLDYGIFESLVLRAS